MKFIRNSWLAALYCVLLLATAAGARALEAATGTPVLVVRGEIAVTNAPGGTAVFDRAMLEALPVSRITTTTPWDSEPHVFEGVSGVDLMQAVGASGTEAVALALNDYEAVIPLADFRRYGVILAYRKDGVPMGVREKGPLFVVYPFDADPGLNREEILGRSVWQLKSLEVRTR